MHTFDSTNNNNNKIWNIVAKTLLTGFRFYALFSQIKAWFQRYSDQEKYGTIRVWSRIPVSMRACGNAWIFDEVQTHGTLISRIDQWKVRKIVYLPLWRWLLHNYIMLLRKSKSKCGWEMKRSNQTWFAYKWSATPNRTINAYLFVGLAYFILYLKLKIENKTETRAWFWY